MDRLRWDSEVCEEYLTSLRRISQCLNEQIQLLTSARKSIMRQGVTVEDKTLHEIVARLEKVLAKLNEMDERVLHLVDSLEFSMDIFRSVEKKVGELGTDLLYMGVIQGRIAPTIVATYSNPFENRRSITPDWLLQAAGISGL